MNEEQAVTEDEAVEALMLADPNRQERDPGSERAERIYAAIVHRREDRPRATGMRMAALAGGLAVVAAVTVGSFAVLGGGSGNGEQVAQPGDGAVSADVGGDIAMSCAFGYSSETLAQRDYAFDGELIDAGEPPADGGVALALGRITFKVNEWFKGGDGNTVTLEGGGLPIGYGSEDEGAVLVEGGRYLVSGDEDFVWACGFTKTYSEAMAAEWRAATR